VMAKRRLSRDALLRKEIKRVSSGLKKGEHDLTTTPYGRRFLEVAQWNNAGSKTILRKYRIGPGQLFIPVSHRAYWLNDDQRRRIGPWIDALEQIDKRGDKGPLTALLKGSPVPNEVGVYLADLLERHELMPVHRRNRHRPGTPLYDLSIADSRLALAKESVDTYRKNGMSFDDSVAKAAKEYSIPVNSLENYCKGKRGSSNRKKKRLPPLSP
jgi:helix-turn-helix, Psq domain